LGIISLQVSLGSEHMEVVWGRPENDGKERGKENTGAFDTGSLTSFSYGSTLLKFVNKGQRKKRMEGMWTQRNW